MRYLLDSDIISYSTDQDSPFHKIVIEKLAQLSNEDEVFVSVLTLYEMEYGASFATGEAKEKYQEEISIIQNLFKILPITEGGSLYFGMIKSAYRTATGIKPKVLARNNVDFIIASSAIQARAVVVRHDKIFRKIKETRHDFQLEDWTE